MIYKPNDTDVIETTSVPASNTGYQSQVSVNDCFQISIDWLQGTLELPRDSFKPILDLLTAYHPNDKLDYTTIASKFLGKQWTNSVRTIEAALFCWNNPQSDDDEYTHILFSFPGSWLRALHFSQIMNLLQSLKSMSHKVSITRIDIALDDLQPNFTPNDCYQSSLLGNMSGFSSFMFTGSKSKIGLGSTFYAGDSQSDQRTRIYDTYPKHGFHGIRIERQLKGLYGQAFYQTLLDHIPNCPPDDLPEWLSGYAVGAVIFLDRGSPDNRKKNLDRCPLLSWWSDFLNRLSVLPVKVSPRRNKTTLLRKLIWLYKQVSVSYHIFDTALPGFRESLTDQALQKIKCIDITKIDILKQLELDILYKQAFENSPSWLPI